MRTSIKSISGTLYLLISAPLCVFAQAAPGEPKGGLPNAVFIALVAFAVLLLMAIAILGNVLKNLAYAYKDKLRKGRQGVGAKAALLAFAFTGMYTSSIAAGAEVAEEVVTPVSPYIAGILKIEFYTLAGLIAFELFIVFGLLLLIRSMIRQIVAKPELLADRAVAEAVAGAKSVSFWDRFNKTVPVEQEGEIMMDHDYDGIRELDNSLPPWWKYGFYLTIVVAVVYLWYYHSGAGPTQYDEYIAEVRAGEEAKAAYLARSSGNVDENTVKMGDAASISSGKTLYAGSCAACHAADGGGTVGPNLTDNYWLHGGSINDIFKSIKYGWADKGMKSWKDDFSPKQIADLSSFIKSLNGSTPAVPKEKQGDLYTEGSDETGAADSTKTVAIN